MSSCRIWSSQRGATNHSLSVAPHVLALVPEDKRTKGIFEAWKPEILPRDAGSLWQSVGS